MLPHALRTAYGLLSKRLTYVHAGVTHRCNLRCTMCRIWTRAGDLPEASPDRWREVARLLANRGATTVSLGGGEPFCRTDLPEIVAAFADNGFRVRALTNGVMVNQKALRTCIDAGLADLSFSLDTLDAELQERLDGMPGGLAKRLDNLAMISQTLPDRVTVQLNTVVNAFNLEHLTPIADLAASLGFSVSYIPVHLDPSGGNDFFGCDDELKLPDEAADKLRAAVDHMLDDKRRRGHIANSRSFLAMIPDFLLEGKTDWLCEAGLLYLSLRPDAKASVCHHYETTDAIEVEDLETVWTKDKLKQAIASCPGCLRPCWTEVALLAQLFGPLKDQLQLQRTLRRTKRRPVDAAQIRRLAKVET